MFQHSGYFQELSFTYDVSILSIAVPPEMVNIGSRAAFERPYFIDYFFCESRLAVPNFIRV